MLNLKPLLLAAGAVLGGPAVLLAQVNPAYEVATWRGFKAAAITYTLDDNTSNQLPVAIPLFDQYNFKTTLFTVTNWGPNWAGLRTASANGRCAAAPMRANPPTVAAAPTADDVRRRRPSKAPPTSPSRRTDGAMRVEEPSGSDADRGRDMAATSSKGGAA